jgi:hypothetical protein
MDIGDEEPPLEVELGEDEQETSAPILKLPTEAKTNAPN